MPVTTQSSPGPSGYEAFTYTPGKLAELPEIDAAALRNEASLRAFLARLVRGDEKLVPVTILEDRLPRLQAILRIPASATAFEVEL